MAGRGLAVVAWGAMALGLSLSAQGPSTQALVSGRVISSETGLPLLHARVEVTSSDSDAVVSLTDREGNFTMTSSRQVASFAVSKPGYLPAQISAARLVETRDIVLTPASVISGRVLDASNAPVPDVTISAELDDGISSRRVVATAVSNDIGDYRLAGLRSGRYVVVATPLPAAGQGSQRGDYRIAYPGTGRNAEVLVIGAGEERLNIDFEAPQRTATTTLDQRRESFQSFLTAGNVRGRITDSDGRGLPGAVVRLDIDGVTQMTPTISNPEGRYELRLLPGKRYTLVARRDGFVTTAFGQLRPLGSSVPIEVRSRERRTDVDIALQRLGAIIGRVLDDGGEPIEGASVRLFQARYLQGQRRLVDIGGERVVRTDDRGVYRAAGLLPGEYIVGASVGQLVLRRTFGVTVAEPTVDLPGYGMTYFPGTLDAQTSQRVSIVAGQDFSGVDIAMVRTATARVSGTITDVAGKPARARLIIAPSRRSNALAAAPVGGEVDDAGQFTFKNIQPGEYVIQASSETGEPFSEGPYVSAVVTVSADDIDGLVLRLSEGSRVVGRITFDGEAVPTSFSGVDLRAVPVDWDYTPLNLDGVLSARISNAGPFWMTGLSGPRVMRLISSTQRWTLKSVLLNGIDVTDVPLPFGAAADSIEGLEVVLTDRVSRIAGTVRGLRGEPIRDAGVVIFATDRTKWIEASRFLAAAQSDVDGAFSVRALPPGEYFAAAVAAVDGDKWRDPEFLEGLTIGAERLQLGEGESLRLDSVIIRP